MQEQSERQQAQSPIFQGIRFIEHRGSAQHIPCAYMDRKLERPFSPPWFAAYLRRQRMGLTGVPWSDHCPGGSDLPPTVAQETEELGKQPNHDADLVHGFLSGVWGLTVVEDTAGDRGRRGKKATAASRAAVCTIYSETVCSACRHLHRMALWRGDCGSSNDRASIVGGALERIFQPLCDQIDHHIPSCTAVVWEEERSPNHKAAKAFIHRCTSVAPVPEAWQEHHSLQHMETCE